MKVGIDMAGGDFAPHAMIEATANSLNNKDLDDVIFYLYGEQEVIREGLKKFRITDASHIDRIRIIDCDQQISTSEKPVQAIKSKPNSSIVKALMNLKNDEIDAFVSSGSTGALLSGATLKVGRIRGVKRPALTVILPTYSGCKILLDVGANADCQAIYLQQFAIMGHFYAQFALGKENPETYLINIGSEEEKGSMMYQEAHQLLKNTPTVNFKGNMETLHLPNTHGDVFVCDGFTGNIVLKLAEGFMKMFGGVLKEMVYKSPKNKIAGLLLKSDLKEFKERFDYSDFPVAPLLGIKKPVMKAHGNSDAKTFESAISYSVKYVKSKTTEKIAQQIASLQAELSQNESEEPA